MHHKIIAIIDAPRLTPGLLILQTELKSLNPEKIILAYNRSNDDTARYLATRSPEDIAPALANLPGDIRTDLTNRIKKYNDSHVEPATASAQNAQLDQAILNARFRSLGIVINDEFVLFNQQALKALNLPSLSDLKFHAKTSTPLLLYSGVNTQKFLAELAQALGVKPSDFELPTQADAKAFGNYKASQGLPIFMLATHSGKGEVQFSPDGNLENLKAYNIVHGGKPGELKTTTADVAFSLKLKPEALQSSQAVAYQASAPVDPPPIAPPKMHTSNDNALESAGINMGNGFVLLTRKKLEAMNIDTSLLQFSDKGYLRPGDTTTMTRLFQALGEKLGIDPSRIILPLNNTEIKGIAAEMKKQGVLSTPVVSHKSGAAGGPVNVTEDVWKPGAIVWQIAKNDGGIVPPSASSRTGPTMGIIIKLKPD